MFKKTISIILAIALSAVLMACGGGKSAGQKAEDEAAASKTEAAVSDTAAAAEGTGQEKGSAAAAEISMEDIRRSTASMICFPQAIPKARSQRSTLQAEEKFQILQPD